MTLARWLVLPAFLLLAAGSVRAGDIYADKDLGKLDALVLPKPADVQKFEVNPVAITLKGADDAQQLILTATLAGGKLQDLTGDVKYEVADAKIARVTSNGRVIPL